MSTTAPISRSSNNSMTWRGATLDRATALLLLAGAVAGVVAVGVVAAARALPVVWLLLPVTGIGAAAAGCVISRRCRTVVGPRGGSESRRRWEHEAGLRHLVDQIPAILFTTDSALRFTLSTGSGLAALGLVPNQVVGLGVREYLGFGDEGQAAYEVVRAGLRGESGTYTLAFNDRIWETYISPLLDDEGQPAGVVGVALDVTDRLEHEQVLQQNLERERHLVSQLREVDDMKNGFLQAVSHELRTPLTALRGFASTLSRNGHRLREDQQRLLLERLEANGDKLDRLLTDLLDVDRLSRGILEPRRRETDVTSLVLGVVDDADLGGRPLRVVADPVIANIDAPKFERVVENLLSNAVRHTPADTPLVVGLTLVDEGVLFSLTQHGCPVGDDLKEVIFEPFRQGPLRTPHAPGTGIGLAFVSRIAAMHGGRSWVEDGPDGGARFCVLMPDAARTGDPEHTYVG